MKSALKWVFVAIFALACAAAADELKSANARLFQERIDQLNAETKNQIGVLTKQIESLPAEEQEAVHLQIQELKLQTEISRLQILLEWARTENDEARIVEIESALQNWLNPPVQRDLPEISRDKSVAPGQPDAAGK